MATTESQPEDDDHSSTEATESRNIRTLVIHQMLFRTAWIFKTESVMMPAFLDSISGAGWVRGMLPPLNRFGQSLAPLLLADRLSRTSLKRHWLSRTTFLMSVPFLAIGTLLLFLPPENAPPWFVAFFLFAYAAFFCVHGINQATFNTLQGKLIRPDRRGKLIALVGYVGSPIAVTMAWLLLRPWTRFSPPQFSKIFLFTGTMFLIASFVARHLREDADPVVARSSFDIRKRFADAWQAVCSDRHLRRLCIAAALFACSQLLFPHYQRLGRSMSGYEGNMLMIWVIVQNLSAAVFSWSSGRVADRHGNRRAIRWLMFSAVAAPVIPLVIARYDLSGWFWLTFVWLGLVPVTFRMCLNYALELASRDRHPVYVSTVVFSMAPPILLSPLIGEFVQRIGYVAPFVLISATVFVAWLITLTMIEPREKIGGEDEHSAIS